MRLRHCAGGRRPGESRRGENVNKLECGRWRSTGFFLGAGRPNGHSSGVKLFYTGPLVNGEMLVVMLEKHGIAANQEFAEGGAPDDGDLSRPVKIFVPEGDYDRAYQLFYSEREDEL
jgi:hypothetical protein